MKIRMITGIAGEGFALSPGDTTERFSDAEAIRLINAGFALPFVEDQIERAVQAPVRERRKAK